MLDLSAGKLLVIGVIALFLIGPDKLPQYAAQLASWVRVGRSMLDSAKGRMASELGPEFEDVDWASIDPRRYHPKRLLLDAWNAAPESPAPDPSAGGAVEEESEPDLLQLVEARAQAEEPVRAPAAHHDLTR